MVTRDNKHRTTKQRISEPLNEEMRRMAEEFEKPIAQLDVCDFKKRFGLI